VLNGNYFKRFLDKIERKYGVLLWSSSLMTKVTFCSASFDRVSQFPLLQKAICEQISRGKMDISSSLLEKYLWAPECPKYEVLREISNLKFAVEQCA
jgi:hypothetical protein